MFLAERDASRCGELQLGGGYVYGGVGAEFGYVLGQGEEGISGAGGACVGEGREVVARRWV